MKQILSILGLSSLLLLISSCAIDDGHQQSLEEVNIVQLLCKEGLLASGIYIESINDKIPAYTRNKITKLLVSAEIESQFGKYPQCLNHLERAYYFLSQIELES